MTDTGEGPVAAGYAGLLGNRDFTRLWIGQSISLLGDYLHKIALMWLVLELTGSALAVTTTMLFNWAPMILFGLHGGALADRCNRKIMMVWTDCVRGLTVIALPLLASRGPLGLWPIYGVALALSTFQQLFEPARDAAVPTIVGRKLLVTANASLRAAHNTMGFIGPAIGGVIVAAWGPMPAFYINAATYFASALFIMSVRIPRTAPVEADGRGSLAKEALDGLRYAVRHRAIWMIIMVAFVVNFWLMPTTALLPTYSKELGIGPHGYGFMMSVMLAGSLLGSVWAGSIRSFGRVVPVLAVSLAGLGLSMLTMGLATVAWMVVLCMFVRGLLAATFSIPAGSIIQLLTPADRLGRVTATMRVAAQSSVPLSLALAGLAADAVGVRAVLMAGGVCVVAVAAWSVRLRLGDTAPRDPGLGRDGTEIAAGLNDAAGEPEGEAY